jgi:hypothetical protein
VNIPRRFTKLRRAYAVIAGYFWLPCPKCRQWFGGFEIGRHMDTYPTEIPGVFRCVCKWCAP